MKYCPTCNFTFADFHHVCDFDGSELVPEPERPSPVVSGSRLRSRCWRFLKSPVTIAALGLTAVLSSAVLIGYLDLVNQPKLIAKAQTSLASPEPAVPVTSKEQSFALIEAPFSPTPNRIDSKRLPGSSAARLRRQAVAARSLARQQKANGNQSLRTESARRNQRQASPEKEPVLTAMLKTTWHVLKKPFKF